MNEVFEDDYIDFTTEVQETVFICPSCQWFNGINRCLHSNDHNLDDGVTGIIMCIDYEKIN